MAPRDASSLVAVHRELRRRCTTTSPTLERFFGASKQSMSTRFERLAEIGAAEVVPDEYRDRASLWRVKSGLAFILVVSVKRDVVSAKVLDMSYLPVAEGAEGEINWRPSEGAEDGKKLIKLIVEVARGALDLAEAGEADHPDPISGREPLSLRERVLGTALALPTPVYRVRRRRGSETSWEMRSASHWIMPELRKIPDGVDLHSALRSALEGDGIPCERLSLINDASAAALGTVVDIRVEGKRPPPRDLALLWLSEGVGGGIISGHRLITGNAGFAAEVGHLAVRPDGVLCRHCGVRGCLETIASSGALKRELNSTFAQAEALYSWPDNPPFVEIAGEIRPHPAYTEAMREAGWWTGIALAQILTLLNPQLIILTDHHPAEKPVHELGQPAPVRDEQFQRSLEAALKRNSLDPAYRHVKGDEGTRETFGIQFGLHSKEPHGVDLSAERADILPMIGAAADMVDTFSDAVFNKRLTDSHVATPRG